MMSFCQDPNSDDGEGVAQATPKTCPEEEASDSQACSASSTYHSVPDKGEPGGASGGEQSFLQSNVISKENSPANKRKRDGVDDSECGNR